MKKTIEINGVSVNAYQNEDGTWCAAGVNKEGIGWETDDFDTFEDLVDYLRTYQALQKDYEKDYEAWN